LNLYFTCFLEICSFVNGVSCMYVNMSLCFCLLRSVLCCLKSLVFNGIFHNFNLIHFLLRFYYCVCKLCLEIYEAHTRTPDEDTDIGTSDNNLRKCHNLCNLVCFGVLSVSDTRTHII
jgi:hypothetical protein